MTSKLRWGIAGCAGIALHAVMPAIQQSETSIIGAVASRGRDKAAATAEAFGIGKAYDSYEKLLEDPDIDAVYIPLPNHLHREWTIRAAQAGKHVLCEKPIALNAAEANEMVEACAKAGVHLAEAFMYRHHPRIKRIQAIIRSGEIGALRALRGAFTFNNAMDKGNIRYQADWGGGGLYDVGCYPLSAARLIVGREPEAATVHAFYSYEHDHVDMMASGLVEFSDGVALTFDCGMWASGRQTFEIVGTDGHIEIPSAFLTGKHNAGFTVTGPHGTRTEEAADVNAYQLQIDDFARTARGEASPLVASSDAVLNMKVLDACMQSANERRRITIV